MQLAENDDKPLILVVDDVKENRDLLKKILAPEGYQVALAPSGEVALEIIKKDPPDIILLDYMMPGIDGLETCQKLKANNKTRNIPVIFITAKTEMDDVVKCLEMGAVDYITKPFFQAEILLRIKAHLFTQQKTS
jgi:CheY-like chemotaxis protein